MEINPILEHGVNPTRNMWYVISAIGDRPSLRVGHTAVFFEDSSDQSRNVAFIGGANPSETFSDVHLLNLNSLAWNMNASTGFNPRYEHISYCPSSQPRDIYVLYGANQDENLMDVQKYDVTANSWTVVKCNGNVPMARTHHTTAAFGDCTYIFSGGKSGSEPVQDRQVHCFCAKTNTWSSISVSGECPQPRHGHTICYHGNKLVLFGGMAGTKFYSDVHVLDLEKNAWINPKMKKRSQPEARAGHAAVVYSKTMYVFGGMNKNGMALSDLWTLDLTTMCWSQCVLQGPPPASRLDMAYCVIKWNVEKTTMDELSGSVQGLDMNEQEKASSQCGAANEAREDNCCYMLLIHGGMDTQGEIFDDCLAIRLND